MSVVSWIENTALAEYILVSAYGYSTMLTLHSLGLAIMVGLSGIFSLRVLGLFSDIPLASLARLLKLSWIGFIVNVLSGGALFASQATTYVSDTEFLLKMLFVALGAVFVALMQASADSRSALAGGVATRTADRSKLFAIAALAAWTAAVIAGRLIAYL